MRPLAATETVNSLLQLRLQTADPPAHGVKTQFVVTCVQVMASTETERVPPGDEALRRQGIVEVACVV